jgi:hypothetical protein
VRKPRDHHDLEITLSPLDFSTALDDSRESASKDVAPKVTFDEMDAWWMSAFTEEEREYIRKQMRRHNFHPFTFGSPYRALVYPEDQLCAIADWLRKPKAYPLGLRMLHKAEDLAGADIHELFRVYEAMIDFYYRGRELEPSYLAGAVETCRKQIALGFAPFTEAVEGGAALPSHRGFEQLAIILERQGKLSSAPFHHYHYTLGYTGHDSSTAQPRRRSWRARRSGRRSP